MTLTYALLCRRDRYATGLDIDAARAAAEAHIPACPQEHPVPPGPVVWHETADGVFCAAADGQWINHHLRPEPLTYTEWRVTGDPGPGYPPYSFTWSEGRNLVLGDPEEQARAFMAVIATAPPWADGPHLTCRVVTVQPWRQITT